VKLDRDKLLNDPAYLDVVWPEILPAIIDRVLDDVMREPEPEDEPGDRWDGLS